MGIMMVMAVPGVVVRVKKEPEAKPWLRAGTLISMLSVWQWLFSLRPYGLPVIGATAWLLKGVNNVRMRGGIIAWMSPGYSKLYFAFGKMLK